MENKKPKVKKVIDWEKKFNKLKEDSKIAEDSLKECLNDSYDKERKLEEKLEDKKKGYIISITGQTFTIKNKADAIAKVKGLADLGIWFFEVDRV